MSRSTCGRENGEITKLKVTPASALIPMCSSWNSCTKTSLILWKDTQNNTRNTKIIHKIIPYSQGNQLQRDEKKIVAATAEVLKRENFKYIDTTQGARPETGAMEQIASSVPTRRRANEAT